MTIDVKDQLADGEFFRRVGEDIDGVDISDTVASGDIIPQDDGSGGLEFVLTTGIGTESDLSATFNKHVTVTSARLATIAALPTCTYGAGASGVGATLTGDSNGALAAVDNITPALNDYILVRNQATPANNGLYKLTTVGDGSNPFVLTRAAVLDTAADFVDGLVVHVGAGFTHAGTSWITGGTSVGGTITVGTTAVNWSPHNRVPGLNAGRRYNSEEMDTYEGPLGATVEAKVPGTTLYLRSGGVASDVTQVQTSDLVPGALGLTTGTATGGNACCRVGASTFTFSSSVGYRMYARVKVATAVSDGTDTFICYVGSFPATLFATNTTPTAGIGFLAPADGSNWDCTIGQGSSFTTVDSGVAVSTSYVGLRIDYVPADAAVYYFINGTLVVTQTTLTNLPTGALANGAAIVKSAGTTSRLFHVDLLQFDTREARGQLGFAL